MSGGSGKAVGLGEAKRQQSARTGASPNAVARQILDDLRVATDDSGTSYVWNGAFWEEASTQYLKKLALDTDGEASTNRRREEVVAYLRARTYDRHLSWGRVKDSEVACGNGVADALTGMVRKHTPEDYLERTIPWHYEAGAECPNWDQYLIDWFGEGELGLELIAALQEFFGYVCLSHAKFKKALLLHGPSNTGKSQVVYALQHLVGTRFTCQLSVQHMDDPIMRAVIKGKSLNVMTELSAEAMIADGGFKTLVSTEEPILINEKYKPAEMYTPTAKHVIATNALPRIDDRTLATYNRLLLVPMENEIPAQRQDPHVKDRIIEEMPGILRWAIDGARRLLEREGAWEVPIRSDQLLRQYREEQNPIVGFLKECAEPEEWRAVPLTEVAKLYNAWNQGGRKVTVRAVGKMLRQAGHEVRDARHGKRVLSSLFHWRLIGLPSLMPGETYEDGGHTVEGGV